MYSLFKPENWRYERKFVVSGLSKHEVESIILLNPALFAEIFHERKVNNIYFDTIEFDNYLDNIVGFSKRLKVRIRWYGDLFGVVNRPVLEIKIKDGLVGSKISYPLEQFSLSEDITIDTIYEIFKSSAGIPEAVKYELLCTNFSILNNYRRKYYLSADNDFRITIDSDLNYYKIHNYDNTFLNVNEDKITVVVELKYDSDKDSYADSITSHLPFRLYKSSKYVSGIECLGIY